MSLPRNFFSGKYIQYRKSAFSSLWFIIFSFEYVEKNILEISHETRHDWWFRWFVGDYSIKLMWSTLWLTEPQRSSAYRGDRPSKMAGWTKRVAIVHYRNIPCFYKTKSNIILQIRSVAIVYLQKSQNSVLLVGDPAARNHIHVVPMHQMKGLDLHKTNRSIHP